MYKLQKFPPHIKCEIWMLKISTELALKNQSNVNRSGVMVTLPRNVTRYHSST